MGDQPHRQSEGSDSWYINRIAASSEDLKPSPIAEASFDGCESFQQHCESNLPQRTRRLRKGFCELVENNLLIPPESKYVRSPISPHSSDRSVVC